jgi:hypothetical protein
MRDKDIPRMVYSNKIQNYRRRRVAFFLIFFLIFGLMILLDLNMPGLMEKNKNLVIAVFSIPVFLAFRSLNRCPHCKKILMTLKNDFCNYCGESLRGLPPKPTTSRPRSIPGPTPDMIIKLRNRFRTARFTFNIGFPMLICGVIIAAIGYYTGGNSSLVLIIAVLLILPSFLILIISKFLYLMLMRCPCCKKWGIPNYIGGGDCGSFRFIRQRHCIRCGADLTEIFQ